MSVSLSYAIDNMIGDLWEREYQQYAEQYEVEDPDDIPSEKLENSYYQDIRLIRDHIKITEEQMKELEKQNEEQKKAIQSAYEIVPVDTLKKIEELEEEIKQNQKWFEEINELVEGDKEDPAVESVKDYVKIMNIAFNISIEENKKLKKLDTEAVDIISQLKQEKEELQAELKLAKGGFKLLECVDCKCIILDDLQGQINKLKEELEKSKTDALCFSAQLNFAGEYSDIEDYSQFNEWIKENYKEDEYKKMYEWYDMEDYIE